MCNPALDFLFEIAYTVSTSFPLMKKIFAIGALSTALVAIVFSTWTPITASPLPPFSDTDSTTPAPMIAPVIAPMAVEHALKQVVPQAPTALAAPDPSNHLPASLSIPSIKLVASIAPVGTDSDGAMAVPIVPKTVGWYKDGTIPGTPGSAVLDAHVYLAFKTLKNVKTGDSVYVTNQSGTKLHFVVSATRTYFYTKVPAQTLFAQNDGGAHLNMITCSGTWLPSQGTYDHRLVVYATLASS
jgi:sortase (surface protein transpeptidase)